MLWTLYDHVDIFDPMPPTHHFGMEHFGKSHFGTRIFWHHGHFGTWTFRHMDILAPYKAMWTFRHLCYCAEMSMCWNVPVPKCSCAENSSCRKFLVPKSLRAEMFPCWNVHLPERLQRRMVHVLKCSHDETSVPKWLLPKWSIGQINSNLQFLTVQSVQCSRKICFSLLCISCQR